VVAASAAGTGWYSEMSMAARARGKVTIYAEECKGCGLCVDSCPPKCLDLSPELNPFGVHPARYTGEGCTGCGICFYCCPEPGALTVYRLTVQRKALQPQPGGHYASAP
jgi:2-oxoglutarate ferredoxin oxidoreductase subunit delta